MLFNQIYFKPVTMIVLPIAWVKMNNMRGEMKIDEEKKKKFIKKKAHYLNKIN